MVLSGYTDLQSVTDAINEGAIYKFLTKPWDDAMLRANIEEAFRRKAMLRREPASGRRAAPRQPGAGTHQRAPYHRAGRPGAPPRPGRSRPQPDPGSPGRDAPAGPRRRSGGHDRLCQRRRRKAVFRPGAPARPGGRRSSARCSSAGCSSRRPAGRLHAAPGCSGSRPTPLAPAVAAPWLPADLYLSCRCAMSDTLTLPLAEVLPGTVLAAPVLDHRRRAPARRLSLTEASWTACDGEASPRCSWRPEDAEARARKQ
jgi:hypothetical protein